MKLVQFVVEGFRTLHKVIWSPGDLNVIIGPNASGKSNLLRAFDLLSQAARGGLSDYIQQEGGMNSVVWDGTASEMAFGFRVAPARIDNIDYDVELGYRLELEQVGQSSHRVAGEVLAAIRAGVHPDGQPRLNFFKRSGQRASVGIPPAPLTPLREQAVDEEECLLAAFSGPLVEQKDIAACNEYVQQMRTYQYFQTHRNAVIRQASVARVERQLASDGQNLVSVLHTLYTGDREFKRAVNSAMEAAFGAEFEEIVFPPAADQRVQMRIRWRSLKRETSAADLSDGTLRFLFLITALANPYPPSLIAIDEPEIGLHPGMLPIIAEYARQAAARTQVIFTTHSPEFLDAFGDEPPTTTVTTLDEGKTHLKVLSDDALRYWLKEYTLGRMFRSGELEDLE